MAGFDSVGGGLARGLSRGAQIRMSRQDRVDAEKQQMAEQIAGQVKESEARSLELFETIAEQTGKAAAATGLEDPRTAQMAATAFRALELHAGVLEEHFPGQGVGRQFIEQNLPLLQTTIDASMMEAEAEIARGSTFWANVDGTDQMVTKIPTDEGGFDFYLGDRKLQVEDLRPVVNKTQETTGKFQIPGLSANDSSKEVMVLSQMAAAGNAYAELANRVSQDIIDQPEKVGTVGDVIRGFGSITSQAEGLMNVLNIDYRWANDDGSQATLDDFNFRDLAGETAAVKRTLLDLVFLDLASKGQTGRAVSDRDLQIFMENTGIASGDPKQVIAGLKRGVENNQALFRQNVLSRSRGAFTAEDLIPSGSVDFQDPVGSDVMGQANSAVTEALNSGDLARAEAILDAMEARDTAALERLLGGPGE